jgi:hypothetical protein
MRTRVDSETVISPTGLSSYEIPESLSIYSALFKDS